MSATATPPTLPPADQGENSFEVATVTADATRATIRTVGALTHSTCAVLISVVQAHLHAGRHYLRLDVGGSTVLDEQALAALAGAHRHVAERGGMLVFENAPPRLVDTIRDSALSMRATR
jgi:anti-anti-sigma regulatory factor